MSHPVSKDAAPPPVYGGEGGPDAFVRAFLGSHARLDRRRLRRHRHEPPLRAADGARSVQRPARAPRSYRRRLAHHLGAADRRHREICAVPDAGRQQGRRRHPLAQGARAARPWAKDDDRVSARRRRVRPVLGRRHDHAGDFRALRARRTETGRRRSRALHLTRDHRHPRCAVRRPEPRHGQSRGLLQPDHGGVFRRQRRARTRAYRLRLEHLGGFEPNPGRGVHPRPRDDRIYRPRQRLSGGDRARKRSTPTWAISGGGRSRRPGCSSFCRRSSAIISAKARLFSTTRRRSRTPSI